MYEASAHGERNSSGCAWPITSYNENEQRTRARFRQLRPTSRAGARCEAGACAMPFTPPHGPFNRAQDMVVRDVRSSESGIDVTKSGLSSNVRSLRSPSNPPNCTHDPSTRHMTPTGCPVPPSLDCTPHTTLEVTDTACYTPTTMVRSSQ
jgi:hypothetical protein